jgi:hypothetical protein
MSTANIYPGSPKMWAHLISAYLVTIVAMLVSILSKRKCLRGDAWKREIYLREWLLVVVWEYGMQQGGANARAADEGLGCQAVSWSV